MMPEWPLSFGGSEGEQGQIGGRTKFGACTLIQAPFSKFHKAPKKSVFLLWAMTVSLMSPVLTPH